MNAAMLNKLKKLQKEMTDAQERIESTEYEGKATGITVIVQGSRQVVDVKISMELLTDLECLQDSILLAVNDALAKIDKAHEEVMQRFGGLASGTGLF